MPTYLTFKQAAERIQGSPETIRYWVHIGRLPAFKPGRRVLIKESDLAALIESSPAGPAKHTRTPRRGGK